MHGGKGSQPDKAQGAQGVVAMFGIPVARGIACTCSTYRNLDWVTSHTLSVGWFCSMALMMDSQISPAHSLLKCCLHYDMHLRKDAQMGFFQEGVELDSDI